MVETSIHVATACGVMIKTLRFVCIGAFTGYTIIVLTFVYIELLVSIIICNKVYILLSVSRTYLLITLVS